jgi:type III secretory pathway component EscT
MMLKIFIIVVIVATMVGGSYFILNLKTPTYQVCPLIAQIQKEKHEHLPTRDLE